MVDHLGSLHHSHACDLGQSDSSSGGRPDERRPDRFRCRPERSRESHYHREAATSIDDLGSRRSTDARLDGVADVSNIQPVPRHRCAVQIKLELHRSGTHADHSILRSLHVGHCASNLLGFFLQERQAVAVNLDAEICLDSRRDLIQSHRHRGGKVVIHPRDLRERRVHLGDELFKRPGLPLRFRIEADVDISLVERHRLRGFMRSAKIRHDALDLGESLQRAFNLRSYCSGLRNRNARNEPQPDQRGAFIELRHELRSQKRHRREGHREQPDGETDDTAPMCKGPCQRSVIPCAKGNKPPRIFVCLLRRSVTGYSRISFGTVPVLR